MPRRRHCATGFASRERHLSGKVKIDNIRMDLDVRGEYLLECHHHFGSTLDEQKKDETNMTNMELAEQLEKIAAKYREDDTLPQVGVSEYFWDKENLVSAIRGFGGKWIKHDGGNDEFASIRLESVDYAPMVLSVSKSRVCRKVVSYECEPLLSPSDEADVEVAMGCE